jgi:hypothetical protein
MAVAVTVVDVAWCDVCEKETTRYRQSGVCRSCTNRKIARQGAEAHWARLTPEERTERMREAGRKGGAVGKDDVGYMGVHTRLREKFGPASFYDCVDCGGDARDWSYDGGAPDERRQECGQMEGTVYSLDFSFYSPRCRTCHHQYDDEHGLRG